MFQTNGFCWLENSILEISFRFVKLGVPGGRAVEIQNGF